MVLEDGREAEALAVFAKWGLDCAVVGRVTDTGRMVLRWQGEVVADVPVAPVSGASPVYERPHRADAQAGAAGGQRPRGGDAASRRAAAAAGRAGPRQQALDLRAVRPHGHGRHRAAAGRRRRGGARARHEPRLGADHRLHPALLLRRPASRRHAGGGRGVAQPRRGRRPAAGDHQLPQLRQPRAAAGHGSARRLHRGHGQGLQGARLPGRVRQRLALQRDRRQRDPADAQCRRPRA